MPYMEDTIAAPELQPAPVEVQITKVPTAIRKLQKWTTKTNIADDLTTEKLNELGQLVVREYDIDLTSSSAWEKQNEKALKLAAMVAEEKTFPWPGASNLVYPLISQAATSFAARTYPAIVQDGIIVKGKITGKKTPEKIARAERIGDHMSYQLAEQVAGWLSDMDSLLHYFSVAGIAFKKTYWCVETGQVVSTFLRASDVVVNYWAKTLETAPRITHEYELSPNELITKQRSGEFRKVDLGEGDTGSKASGEGDSQAPHMILEQCRWVDLDEDDYAEPYTIWVHKKSKEVLRIAARWEDDGLVANEKGEILYIRPEWLYTKFTFMPSMDGSFYGLGFGYLLTHSNKIINSIINQMIDAGSLANCGGGLISDDLEIFGKKVKSGKFILSPGEYMVAHDKGSGVDLRGKMIPFQFAGPSAVLFELAKLIIEGSQRLSSTTEALSGEQQYANQPATTTLALIEQATKFFTAIRARLYDSLKAEFKKIYRLNRRNIQDQEYNTILDPESHQIAKADYEDEDCDVVPVADPKDATDAQKMLKAQAVREFLAVPIQTRQQLKAGKLYLEALNVPDAEDYLPAEGELGQPTPEIQLEMEKLKVEQARIAVEERKVTLLEKRLDAEIGLVMKPGAIQKLSDAESKEIGSQMQEYKADMEALKTEDQLQQGEFSRQVPAQGEGAATEAPAVPAE